MPTSRSTWSLPRKNEGPPESPAQMPVPPALPNSMTVAVSAVTTTDAERRVPLLAPSLDEVRP